MEKIKIEVERWNLNAGKDYHRARVWLGSECTAVGFGRRDDAIAEAVKLHRHGRNVARRSACTDDASVLYEAARILREHRLPVLAGILTMRAQTLEAQS